jgi:hypothetical protein
MRCAVSRAPVRNLLSVETGAAPWARAACGNGFSDRPMVTTETTGAIFTSVALRQWQYMNYYAPSASARPISTRFLFSFSTPDKMFLRPLP